MTSPFFAGNRGGTLVRCSPHEIDSLTRLFFGLTRTLIDEDTGHRAGVYLRQYRRSYGLEIADALIAASAVAHTARLWTRNRKYYPMCDLSFFE